MARITKKVGIKRRALHLLARKVWLTAIGKSYLTSVESRNRTQELLAADGICLALPNLHRDEKLVCNALEALVDDYFGEMGHAYFAQIRLRSNVVGLNAKNTRRINQEADEADQARGLLCLLLATMTTEDLEVLGGYCTDA